MLSSTKPAKSVYDCLNAFHMVLLCPEFVINIGLSNNQLKIGIMYEVDVWSEIGGSQCPSYLVISLSIP